MGLQQFERRLERLVEGVFARAFRSGLQPVELGRRLTREIDLGRKVGVNGMIAPNHFSFALAPADLEKIDSFREALLRELADLAREHARAQGYAFVGPVEIEMAVADNLGAGVFLLAGEVREGPGGGSVGTLVLADGSRVAIGNEALSLGRLPECDVHVNDPNVSRKHAEVRRQGNDFIVVDLESLNGTRVNGTAVRERVLVDGDEISVGASTVRFEAS